MRIDPEQHMLVLRSEEAWIEQARTAIARIEHLQGKAPIGPETAKVAPVAFGQLVEAMVALEQAGGPAVGQDWIDAAGLVPVDQAVMGDD